MSDTSLPAKLECSDLHLVAAALNKAAREGIAFEAFYTLGRVGLLVTRNDNNPSLRIYTDADRPVTVETIDGQNRRILPQNFSLPTSRAMPLSASLLSLAAGETLEDALPETLWFASPSKPRTLNF